MNKLQESFPDTLQKEELLQKQVGTRLRVAVPGIIQSFDVSTQTATVQCALREQVDINGTLTWVDIPLLLDVPVIFPRAGGYALTMPVVKGDECLVVFGDACIDAWWQSGGIQNQVEIRRHDLSDGMAIMGLWSQPRVIPGYSMDGAELRNDSGSARITISGDNITISAAGNITIQGASVNIN